MARKTRTRIATALVAGLAAASLLVAMLGNEAAEGGRDAATLAAQTAPPGIEAYFLRESYRPGDIATLVVDSPVGRASLQMFRVGDAPASGRRFELRGAPVTARRQLVFEPGSTRRRARHDRCLAVGDVLQRAPDGGRSGRLRHVRPCAEKARGASGGHRDADEHVVCLQRARRRRKRGGRHLVRGRRAHNGGYDPTVPRRGVPPHFGHYDFGFLRWLFLGGRAVDVLSQRELEREVTGEELARAYDLIVFPGHHEYVTATSSTSSSATATSAATSCSSRPTTSTTRSPRAAT